MNTESEAITYLSSGVDYTALDKFKKLAQLKARESATNISVAEVNYIEESRGESAYVWEEKDCYRAIVIEGLGSKNLVADEMSKITGRSYYQQIAQDAVACIVNDLIVVGARPQVVNAYFAVGSSAWFKDEKRSNDLIDGWARACGLANCIWGGGETSIIQGLIEHGAIDIAGCSVGLIEPKERLIIGDKLSPDDAILLIESSGIHANGLTLARNIASKLENGYNTKLDDGTIYGESLLKPAHIYAELIKNFFENGIDIHYMVNITGHGWRKLMRASRQLNYIISDIPKPQEIFNFIQEKSENDDYEMYANFNMGAGFAVFMPKSYVDQAMGIAKDSFGLKTYNAGLVKDGPRQVIIEPKNVTFKSESLEIR